MKEDHKMINCKKILQNKNIYNKNKIIDENYYYCKKINKITLILLKRNVKQIFKII